MLPSRSRAPHRFAVTAVVRSYCPDTLRSGLPMLLSSFERDADALLTAVTRARYLEASGRWPVLALSGAYERFPEVSSLDSYEQLLDAETDERVAVGLQNLVLEQFVATLTARHDERLVAAERNAVVDWGGQEMPWRLA